MFARIHRALCPRGTATARFDCVSESAASLFVLNEYLFLLSEVICGPADVLQVIFAALPLSKQVRAYKFQSKQVESNVDLDALLGTFLLLALVESAEAEAGEVSTNVFPGFSDLCSWTCLTLRWSDSAEAAPTALLTAALSLPLLSSSDFD